jgi:hypothetical protein
VQAIARLRIPCISIERGVYAKLTRSFGTNTGFCRLVRELEIINTPAKIEPTAFSSLVCLRRLVVHTRDWRNGWQEAFSLLPPSVCALQLHTMRDRICIMAATTAYQHNQRRAMIALQNLPSTVTAIHLRNTTDDTYHLQRLPHLAHLEWGGFIRSGTGRAEFARVAQCYPKLQTLSFNVLNLHAKNFTDAIEVAHLLRVTTPVSPSSDQVVSSSFEQVVSSSSDQVVSSSSEQVVSSSSEQVSHETVQRPLVFPFYDNLQVLVASITSRFTFWTAIFPASALVQTSRELDGFPESTDSGERDPPQSSDDEKEEGDVEDEIEGEIEEEVDIKEENVEEPDELTNEGEDVEDDGSTERDPDDLWNDCEEKRIQRDYNVRLRNLILRKREQLAKIRTRKLAAVSEYRRRHLKATITHNNLRVLDLSRSLLKDMEVLRPCAFPALRVLDMSDARFQPKGLQLLEKFKSLQVLSLRRVNTLHNCTEKLVASGRNRSNPTQTKTSRKNTSPQTCNCLVLPHLPELLYLDLTDADEVLLRSLNTHGQASFAVLYPQLKRFGAPLDLDLSRLHGTSSLTSLHLSSTHKGRPPPPLPSPSSISKLLERLPNWSAFTLPSHLHPVFRRHADLSLRISKGLLRLLSPYTEADASSQKESGASQKESGASKKESGAPQKKLALHDVSSHHMPSAQNRYTSVLERCAWDIGVYLPLNLIIL